jgi:hypothetical protein
LAFITAIPPPGGIPDTADGRPRSPSIINHFLFLCKHFYACVAPSFFTMILEKRELYD